MRLMILAAVAFLMGCGGSGTEATFAPQKGQYILVAFDTAGDMHCLSPTNGLSRFVLDTSADFGEGSVDLARISSAVWHTQLQQLLIGRGGNQGNGCQSCLLSLDTLSGIATLVRDFQSDHGPLAGMAARASDGMIYMPIAESNGMDRYQPQTDTFEELNITAGATEGNGIAFAADGTLYLVSDGELYSIDPATGDATFIEVLSFVGFPTFTNSNPKIVSMATDPITGTIYCVVKDKNGTPEAFLATLDVDGEQLIHVGPLSEDFDGLAFVPTAEVLMP